MLREGNVLIGNMQITKDYFILGPNDVYDIPPDAIYETNSWGQKISHFFREKGACPRFQYIETKHPSFTAFSEV
jgi:hypothetical protein